MIGLNKIGLNQVQLNQLYLNTLCACKKSSGGDGFPRLPGDVTRWSFKGLTNEMMAKNPRLEDADHKGRFLTFKNFAWGGMSGCNGYDYNFMGSSFAIIGSSHGTQRSSDKVVILKANNGQANFMCHASVLKCRIRITNVSKLVENGDVTSLDIWGYNELTKFSTKADGIYDIDLSAESGIFYFMARAPKGTVEEPLILSSPITIELLPYYPGFIIGDGVDDYAVSEKDLDFEDTYTVYTAFIPFQEDPARNMLLCGKAYTKDFYVQYKDLKKLMYYSAGTRAIVKFSNGFNLIACKRTPTQMVAKNLLTGETIVVDANSLVENPGLYYLWTTSSKMEYSKAAIAGQVICNGHFTTDEEDTKVLNWYKKEYPWLFFDQAWTVTGKTNEDTDRATIANITGNGNNLVLSNSGFAEGSGYGLYAYNFNSFSLRDNVVKPTDVKKDSFRMIGTGNSNNVLILLNESDSADWKIRITGMKEGDRCLIGNANKSGEHISVTKDGTYTLQKQYAATSTNGIWYNSSQEVDVLVEQIPQYEGYLVTDGVDDTIASSAFKMGKDFTIIGEWKFVDNIIATAGIVKSSSLFVYNTNNGLKIFINSTNKGLALNTKTLKAICSNGRVYSDDWSEMLVNEEQSITSSKSGLLIGINGNNFAKIALKNLAIYNQILSKYDCVKAYNYLQTLKAK